MLIKKIFYIGLLCLIFDLPIMASATVFLDEYVAQVNKIQRMEIAKAHDDGMGKMSAKINPDNNYAETHTLNPPEVYPHVRGFTNWYEFNSKT